MLIDFVISKRVGTACNITTAVEICFVSKTVNSSAIKTTSVDARFIGRQRIIFNEDSNIIRNTIFEIPMDNKIYTALYHGIQNIMLGQKSKRYAKNCNESGAPYKRKGV